MPGSFTAETANSRDQLSWRARAVRSVVRTALYDDAVGSNECKRCAARVSATFGASREMNRHRAVQKLSGHSSEGRRKLACRHACGCATWNAGACHDIPTGIVRPDYEVFLFGDNDKMLGVCAR